MSKKYIWELEEEKLEKERKEKKKKEDEIKKIKKKKKNRKIITTISLIVFFIIVFFVPFFKVDTLNVENSYYFTTSKISSDLDIGERISIFGYIKKLTTKNSNLYYLEKSTLNYNVKDSTMTLTVDEKIPLYHDEEGNNYYYDEYGDVGIWDVEYETPLIIEPKEKDKNKNSKKSEDTENDTNKEDTDEYEDLETELTYDDMFDQLLDGLGSIDYDVRAQIEQIEAADPEEYGSGVLKFSMIDGNTVYIYPYQVGDKMQYYNQMMQILDANDKGEGNIYLYIGDYYDPYD